MDLRQLKYFIAVVEERNFGRAAVRLHITQPPITRQIALLEQELKAPLLERTHWGVEPTQAGASLYQDACNIRALVDQAMDRTRRIGQGLAGTLDVGIFGSGALVIVPDLLRRFSNTFPEVQIALLNVPEAEQLQALRQKRLLITFDRYLPRDPDLTVETVCSEALFLALPDTSPFAKRKVVPLDALRDEPMIKARDPGHAEWLMALCRANGFEPKVSQQAAEMVSGLSMVANGFGCQVVPDSIRVLARPGVVFRPLKTRADASIPLECAYRRGESSPLLQALTDIAHAYRGPTSRH